jgi:hypothetical protein
MPALSFSIAKEKIKSGAKRQTIRGDRRFPIKKGDRLFLYWKQQSPKDCEKLGEANCTSVRSVTISTDNLSYCDNGYDSTIRDDFGLLSFAVNDGFNNWQELVKFFENTHGLPFTGNLIKWDEIV